MAARTCTQCGATLTEGQRFCGKCGAPAPEQPATPVTTPVPTQPPPAPPQPPAAPPQPPPEQPPPAAGQAAPPENWTPLPPAPAPTSLPPEPVVQRPTGPHWSAWLGVGGCGLLAIATGLSWFAGTSVNGFDIPMSALWSGTPTGSLPIAVPFLLIAASGLAVAMIKPVSGALGTTLLVAGGLSVVLAALFVIRVLSTAQGLPILDVLSIGVWGVIVASLAAVGAGVTLLLRKPGR